MTPAEKIEFIYNFLCDQELYLYPSDSAEYIQCKRYLRELKKELSE